tara:strand:+ start:84 stop:386 length:303 start_codon:yes stop_codon:yes gene_type:complete
MKAQVKKPQVHRTPKQWHQLVSAFDPNKQTIHAYCKNNNIGTSSFYKWKATLGAPESTEKEDIPAFVPIQTHVSSNTSQAPAWDLELELGSGITLRLSKS